MIELEENIKLLNILIESFKEIQESLNLDVLKEELASLESKTLEDNFWNNPESNKVYSRIKTNKEKINLYEKNYNEAISLKELNELLMIEFDEALK